MTLTELARTMRKNHKFKFLTAHAVGSDAYLVNAYTSKPLFSRKYKVWCKRFGKKYRCSNVIEAVANFDELDLSEYKKKDGKINFSRCIVEVKNDC